MSYFEDVYLKRMNLHSKNEFNTEKKKSLMNYFFEKPSGKLIFIKLMMKKAILFVACNLINGTKVN